MERARARRGDGDGSERGGWLFLELYLIPSAFDSTLLLSLLKSLALRRFHRLLLESRHLLAGLILFCSIATPICNHVSFFYACCDNRRLHAKVVSNAVLITDISSPGMLYMWLEGNISPQGGLIKRANGQTPSGRSESVADKGAAYSM